MMSWTNVQSVKLFILTILMLHSIHASNLYENHVQHELNQSQHNKQIFKKLLLRINNEENFKNCVILGKSLPEFAIEEILQKDFEKKVILLPNISSVRNLQSCGKHFLVIVRWHQKESSHAVLKSLADIINFKRFNKVLVIKNDEENNFRASSVEHFFVLCKLLKLPNTVLIFKDFCKTQNLYQFHIYPRLTVMKNNLKHKTLVFPNKIKNLYGTALRSMPDQILPETAAFIDAEGRVQVKGYVMQFLNHFIKYINASLDFPLNITIGKTLEYDDIYKLTQQDLIDVPASLSGCYTPECFHIMSETYEINKWCIMVPIEKPYSYKDYLNADIPYEFGICLIFCKVATSMLLVLSKKLWSLKNNKPYNLRISEIFLNIDIVAGMLANSFKQQPQPSRSMKLIYISVSIFGLLHFALSGALIQTFLAQPFGYRIKSLADLPAYNLRIVIARDQYEYILRYFNLYFDNPTKVFKIVHDYEEFFKFQTALNTSYAYPITSPLWFMYNALQTYLNKPIFRLTNMCFPYYSIMGFVLPPNSLFMERLNHLIIRVRDMGLLEYWLKTSYIDLVKIKKIYIPKDLSVVKKSSVLQLEDFEYAQYMLLKFFLIAFIIFLVEIFYHKYAEKKKQSK